MVRTESHAAKPIDGFLVLRAYACLLVLVNHVYGSLPPGSWHQLLLVRGHNLSWAIHTPAWSGVWIFFTLSGYLMGKAFFTGRYALNRHGAGEFYHNRAWRIGPLYLLVVAISCLLQAPEVFYRENWTVLVRMLTFTYMHNRGSIPMAPCGRFRPKCNSSCSRPPWPGWQSRA